MLSKTLKLRKKKLTMMIQSIISKIKIFVKKILMNLMMQVVCL